MARLVAITLICLGALLLFAAATRGAVGPEPRDLDRPRVTVWPQYHCEGRPTSRSSKRGRVARRWGILLCRHRRCLVCWEVVP
jgi:hypothetical protein